jgi:hypothetical protein
MFPRSARIFMINFEPNIENIVSSSLEIKASGSIIEEVKNDLNLQDGENISILLQNEKNISKNTQKYS